MEDSQYPYFFGNNILVHNSTYFLTKTDNKPDAVRVADAACKAVNDSFQTFMQEQFCCTPGFDNLIKSVREIVASRAILIKKKKYIFKVVDAEGHPTDKIKSTGVDIKKTTIPKPISKKLEAFVKRLLDGEDWDSEIAPDIVAYKDELLASDDFTIFGSPMGVKGMEEYTSKYEIFGMKANLPGHTAGSIHWNECLTKYGDRESPRIMSGMKIRVYYLTQTFGKFKNIAVPGDIETYPEWFLKNFVPLIDRKLQIEKLVDGPIENIVKAIGRTAPTKQQLLQNSLLVF